MATTVEVHEQGTRYFVKAEQYKEVHVFVHVHPETINAPSAYFETSSYMQPNIAADIVTEFNKNKARGIVKRFVRYNQWYHMQVKNLHPGFIHPGQ